MDKSLDNTVRSYNYFFHHDGPGDFLRLFFLRTPMEEQSAFCTWEIKL